jgi:hypothetical protein
VFPAGGGQLRYAISLGQKMKITEGAAGLAGQLTGRRWRRPSWPGGWTRTLPRPAVPDKPEATVDPEVVRIRSALLDGVPAETSHAIASSVSAVLRFCLIIACPCLSR